ncbi:MAG: Hsp20/alpha crystallin family protein [Candidatus Bipolaricaulota bacterium]|nr:MAG: Hsp20/alpha crystallin family protein [Candidatus Bipolaricaulota bacterium]
MVRRLPELRRGPFIVGTGLSRMIDDLFRDFDSVGLDLAPRLGCTDIYEKDKALVFETELPGMTREQIDLKVEDDQLVVSGETKRNEEIDRENYFRVGRQYGRIRRAFPLPAELVDRDGIKARFENGILRVTVPLKESIKEKQAPIEISVE